METACFYLKTKEEIKAPAGVFGTIHEELYRNFTFSLGTCRFVDGAENRLSIGRAPEPALNDGESYAMEITADGVGIAASDEKNLIRALSALFLRMLPCDREGFVCKVPAGTVRGNFSVGGRFAHLCVFPENCFSEIRQRVRLLGLLQYTHIILEFWGTVPLSSFPQGNWASRSFSEEQVRLLAEEGRALGAEMIPAFNCLGHASGARVLSGKHTVLDPHPELAPLFTPDGWCWDLANPKVFPLLRGIREDLNRLFGHPGRFHLGCDEADIYENGYLPAKDLAAFVGALTADVERDGQIPMVWGDLFLPSGFRKNPRDDAAARMLLSSLSPRTEICDWDYHVTESPVRSALYLKESGRPVLGCAFREPGNIRAYVETAKSGKSDGVMITTWHRWAKTPVLEAARLMGLPEAPWSRFCDPFKETAMLARKALPGSRYEEYGFAALQLGNGLD